MRNNGSLFSIVGILLVILSTILTILNLSPIFVIASVVLLIISLVLFILGQRSKISNKLLNKIAFVFLIVTLFELIIIFFMVLGLLLSSVISI